MGSFFFLPGSKNLFHREAFSGLESKSDPSVAVQTAASMSLALTAPLQCSPLKGSDWVSLGDHSYLQYLTYARHSISVLKVKLLCYVYFTTLNKNEYLVPFQTN